MKNKSLCALTSHDRKGNTGQPTGFYLPEAAHPWAVLNAAGFEIDFAAATIYDDGGVIGAVCHGPAALVNLKLANGQYLVKGKRVAAFTDDEERAVKLETVVPFLLATMLRERGATRVPAPNW